MFSDARPYVRWWWFSGPLEIRAIDEQLDKWGLTSAEKEVAFLLLKGLSSKEIAHIRNTAEKTARVQSMAIYSKSGLANRSELSAFFLEDLLVPPNN